MNKTFTWFSTGLHTLLVRVEAVLVSAAASVPEARAALAGRVKVPLEDKFGTRTFLFGKLANVHGCRGRCGEEVTKKNNQEKAREHMSAHTSGKAAAKLDF